MKHSKKSFNFYVNDNFDFDQTHSQHAAVNFRRRGIKNEEANAVYTHADIEVERGGGVVMLKISRKALLKLGGRTPEGVQTDRLKNLCLLVANDNTCVTGIKPRDGKYKIGRS
jgi:hypothetical protein